MLFYPDLDIDMRFTMRFLCSLNLLVLLSLYGDGARRRALPFGKIVATREENIGICLSLMIVRDLVIDRRLYFDVMKYPFLWNECVAGYTKLIHFSDLLAL